jgi:hypothetical protein
VYVIDVSSKIEKAVLFASEYKNKILYKTVVVKDNGMVEFKVKETSGLTYQVVYDYKNDEEISKTLVENAHSKINNALKDMIGANYDGFILNKNKTHAIAITKENNFRSLYIYDTSDLSNPIQMHEIIEARENDSYQLAIRALRFEDEKEIHYSTIEKDAYDIWSIHYSIKYDYINNIELDRRYH